MINLDSIGVSKPIPLAEGGDASFMQSPAELFIS